MELYGEDSVVQGDALEVAPHCPEHAFRLIYIDPPFFTGKEHRNRKGDGGFKDHWAGGLEEFLGFLRERLEVLKLLLAGDGSLLLHLDWRAIHYAKVMCDGVFGAECFQNEIIWAYNSGGGCKTRYGRKHDTILWYSTGKNAYFDREAARVPYDAVIAEKRRHLFHPDGKVSGDVLHISRPPNHAKEWTGWPTQKPLELLRFLVRVHSAPGDLVGDFFCGSGTTLVAAQQEGRRWFGCDVSAEAVSLANGRLKNLPSVQVDLFSEK